MYRIRKSEKAYGKLRKTQVNMCVFCNIQSGDDKIVRETEHFWVYKNLFSYDTWDNLDVIEHLMIIPRQHVTNLGELSKPAREAYIELITDYDAKKYSHYLRAAGNATKTIQHMHTHLIQLDSKPHKIHFFLRKPYLLWFK